uniref:Uncharacterized protein MANES_11G048200 n=1 Tax=Rhizophora mucronata TaxID=61149 RepID=A0A2P2K016_RHIMU
MTFSPAVKNN